MPLPCLRLLLLSIACTLLCPGRAAAEQIDFNRDIKSILSNRCYFCHGPDPQQRQGGIDGLRLDTRAGALADLGGHAAIVPGDVAASVLVERVTSTEDGVIMPPLDSGHQLTAKEIDLLRRWIQQGAIYAEHWSYVPPVRPPVPPVKQSAWPRTPIDHFILSRLEQQGLSPSHQADADALVRRLFLDLTGLPPSIDEVDAFLADTDPAAYERLVDALLSRNSYGEHWARLWLDLARYADSAGYADDPLRTIWLYRDYVIESINANKPFDQFTIEQIAGDLLPDATDQQLIATAFHRNTLTNNEGGTDDEEFRNAAVVDRVNTTLAVWMGTTMACAQCHTHKYDPISQEEYFKVFAILNNTQDADRRDESPLHSIYTLEQQRQRQAWEAELQELESILNTPTAERIAASIAPELAPQRRRAVDLTKKLAELKPVTVPIMSELAADERRTTRLQHRGNFMSLGDEVQPGTPEIFPPLPSDRPADRLALAQWLVDEANPLTPRVIANRYWEKLFGTGIVATSEEFGSQGEMPSHPELLDWLATELVRLDWDTKSLVKLLVLSATYRQSSRVDPELYQLDPDNRLLARGPRFRLSAETIRDQALAVGGLLSEKMHGPPVNPPQPAIGLSAAFGSGIDWKTSEGEDRYRRGLYTTWRRSNPYPSMTTFDAPNREVCTLRRGRSNTPLQALVTLNDPVFVEAAQGLARRMMLQGGDRSQDRAGYGFRLCLARHAKPQELERLVQLYETARRELSARPGEAMKLATDPLGPVPEGVDAVELAAWTTVANVLLNLDETLMRR